MSYFIFKAPECLISHHLLLLEASFFNLFFLLFIYLPLPPSADVNTRYNRHDQDYQQDHRHNDSYAP